MTLLTLLLLSLATWRSASLLAREAGPLDILSRFRHWAGVRYNERSEAYGTNVVSKAMVCLWCGSVWIGAGWALLFYFLPGLAPWLSLPFALSAAAIVIERVIYGA